MNKDFCIFILTHGRPDNVRTVETLEKQNYTGDFYIIVDDTDKTINEYKKKYGQKVIVFSKNDIARTHDRADNFTDWKTIFFARNACFDIARKLKYKYFMQLDDDYTSFSYRVNTDDNYKQRRIHNLDAVFGAMLKFYKNTPITSLAMAQGGDYIGGIDNGHIKNGLELRRKAMNSFICSTDRPFKFIGRVNEDVNTYIHLGSTGKLFCSVFMVALNQLETQKNDGGMTDTYLESGTYVKTFYSVIINPSCVTVSIMGDKYRRMHHKVNWNHAVPKILHEKYKK